MPSLWRQLISRLRSATLTLCQRRNNLESGEIEKKYIYIYFMLLTRLTVSQWKHETSKFTVGRGCESLNID